MKNYLAALICLLIGGGLAYFMVPKVWTDLMVDKASLERAPEYSVTDAECRVKAFVLSTCDLEFAKAGSEEPLKMSYMLFGDFGGEPVYAMQTPDKTYVTSNIGVETVMNRVIMMMVLCGFMIGGGLFLLIQTMRGKVPAKKA